MAYDSLEPHAKHLFAMRAEGASQLEMINWMHLKGIKAHYGHLDALFAKADNDANPTPPDATSALPPSHSDHPESDRLVAGKTSARAKPRPPRSPATPPPAPVSPPADPPHPALPPPLPATPPIAPSAREEPPLSVQERKLRIKERELELKTKLYELKVKEYELKVKQHELKVRQQEFRERRAKAAEATGDNPEAGGDDEADFDNHEIITEMRIASLAGVDGILEKHGIVIPDG